MNKWQRKSETFDFSKEDAAPDLEFSEVIWYAIKGEGVPFPRTRIICVFEGERGGR